MSPEARKYLVVSGQVDDMSPSFGNDLENAVKKHRRPCKSPLHCRGEMYFNQVITLRPGSLNQKKVASYVCVICKYAVMEEL